MCTQALASVANRIAFDRLDSPAALYFSRIWSRFRHDFTCQKAPADVRLAAHGPSGDECWGWLAVLSDQSQLVSVWRDAPQTGRRHAASDSASAAERVCLKV